MYVCMYVCMDVCVCVCVCVCLYVSRYLSQISIQAHKSPTPVHNWRGGSLPEGLASSIMRQAILAEAVRSLGFLGLLALDVSRSLDLHTGCLRLPKRPKPQRRQLPTSVARAVPARGCNSVARASRQVFSALRQRFSISLLLSFVTSARTCFGLATHWQAASGQVLPRAPPACTAMKRYAILQSSALC